MKKINLILIGVLLLLTAFSCDKEKMKPVVLDQQASDLTDSLQRLQDQLFIPGFAVTVVKNDQVAYQNSFGLANIANEVKYTDETTQPIASVSKTFIAAALMKAIEQGHFTLDTDINDVLPFKVINPYQADEVIRIRHLVTHTSGLIDEPEIYNVKSYYYLPGEFEKLTLGMKGIITEYGTQEGSEMPLGDYLKSYYTAEGSFYSEDNFSESAPNEEYEYSNVAASLTAYLIEATTGITYRDYVKQYVFNPLDMKDAGFRYQDVEASRAATLYLSRNDFFPIYQNHSYPDGQVNASNYDMGKFLLEMIRGNDGKGNILSQESYQTLFNRNELPDVDGDFAHGIFWDITNGRIEHSGGDPGVITLLSFDPITKTGFYFMMNIDTGSDVGEEIFEQYEKIIGHLKDFEKK